MECFTVVRLMSCMECLSQGDVKPIKHIQGLVAFTKLQCHLFRFTQIMNVGRDMRQCCVRDVSGKGSEGVDV